MTSQDRPVLNAALIGSLVLAGVSGLAAQDQPARPLVVTVGTAVVRVPPDRGFVVVSAEARAKDPRAAQRRNAVTMTAVQDRLKEARVPADAIRTLAYDLEPQFDYVDGRQTLREYLARNTIEVRLDELDRVGEVIDIAVSAGATTISSVRFDLRDREKVEREALRLAVADAYARAEAAAAGAGRAIEGVLRIEEAQESSYPQPRQMRMMQADVAVAPETPVVSGQIEVQAQVRLTATLK